MGQNNVVKLLQQSPLLSPSGQSLFLVVVVSFFWGGVGGGQDLAILLVSSSEFQHNHSSHKWLLQSIDSSMNCVQLLVWKSMAYCVFQQNL